MCELLFMKPFTREVLWGGRKLRDIYHYETEGEHTGEAWVISGNSGGQSVVSEGCFQGKTLGELWDNHRELFGNTAGAEFPLLLKLIDAEDDLSIQVHPDDSFAREHENAGMGKTECWYIVDCEPGADIIIGHTAKSREELEQRIQEGQWEELLQKYPIHKGDFFYIPAGTVHAIRRGTLILEIQQSSDLTYRLYDYDRLQDGKKRELHLEKAMEVIRCPQQYEPTAGELESHEGYGVQKLVQCPYFAVHKYLVEEKLCLKEEDSFLMLNVLEGSGSVNGHPIKPGDNFIAPKGFEALEFNGKMTLLVSHI